MASSKGSTKPVRKTKTSKATMPDTGAVKVQKASPTKSAYQKLDSSPGLPIPVEVFYSGTTTAAKNGKAACFSHIVRLQGSDSFTLSKTVVLQEGPFEGYQAILIRPKQPFPFLRLPRELQFRIYQHYFAPTSNAPLLIDARRSQSKAPYAKKYAAGSRNRVALLAVNKEINETASPVLYHQTIAFESTAFLLEYLVELPATARERLFQIEARTYQRPSARMALNLLAEMKHIHKVTFTSGVGIGHDIEKIATLFYNDSSKFLESKAADTGDKCAAMKILEFGGMALTVKTGDQQKPWTSAMVKKFVDEVKVKLLLVSPTGWACVCGSSRRGHSCADVLEGKRQERELCAQLARRGLTTLGNVREGCTVETDGIYSLQAVHN